MPMAVASAMTATPVVVTVIIAPAVTAVVIAAAPVPAVIAVTTVAPTPITAVVVTHEIHRLAARAVLAAITRPVLGMAGRHAHVDGALVHGHRRLLDDDRLGVDQHGLLVTDIDTPIKTGLRHTDADTDIGGAGLCALAAQGKQTEDAKSATKGAAKRELMR